MERTTSSLAGRLAVPIKAACLVAALALGGCELLSEMIGDDLEGQSGAGATLKGPPPPPAAPRVPRANARRSPNDRGTGEFRASASENGVETAQPASPDTAATIAALPPAETEVPAAPSGDRTTEMRTDLVIGLTEKSLVGWLGEPANRREQSPARIWRYLGAGCALDVFLFLDLVSREFRALSYEVKGTTNDDQRCLEPVFAGRGSAPRTTASRLD